MSFNTKKTICMVFNPATGHKIVCKSLIVYSLLPRSNYLGHIIDNSVPDSYDNDIEIKTRLSEQICSLEDFQNVLSMLRLNY